MATTHISSPPSGRILDTVKNIPSVRNLNFVEGSDYITVTTDDEVHVVHYNNYIFENINCIFTGYADSIGNVF